MQTATFANDGYNVDIDYCEYCGCPIGHYEPVTFTIVDGDLDAAFCGKACARKDEEWLANA